MQLHQHVDELNARKIDVLVVTFESTSRAREYEASTEIPWPIVNDTDRSLYAAYGMGIGSRGNVYGLSSWWVYAKLMARGRRLQRPQGNFRQLGGDVLIDPEGIVRLHYIGSGPADRPSVQSILDCVTERS